MVGLGHRRPKDVLQYTRRTLRFGELFYKVRVNVKEERNFNFL